MREALEDEVERRLRVLEAVTLPIVVRIRAVLTCSIGALLEIIFLLDIEDGVKVLVELHGALALAYGVVFHLLHAARALLGTQGDCVVHRQPKQRIFSHTWQALELRRFYLLFHRRAVSFVGEGADLLRQMQRALMITHGHSLLPGRDTGAFRVGGFSLASRQLAIS